RSAVNRGYLRSKRSGSVRLGIRISGFGEVLRSKMFVDIPLGVFGRGEVWSNLTIEDAPDKPPRAVPDATPQKQPMFEDGFRITGIAALFLPDVTFKDPSWGSLVAGESVVARNEWPITAESTIRRDAAQGDHEITVVLT